ncbi:MAG: recombinase family protein [Clostridia bacterium]|nr:recombinase family protein [Clostridia bacterium]
MHTFYAFASYIVKLPYDDVSGRQPSKPDGTEKEKQNLDLLSDAAEARSTIICTEVSRLSCSAQQLCEIIEIIKKKHMRLVIVGSITIDCRNGEIDPMSAAFMKMAGVFSELELQMIRARVKTGLSNAKAKGKKVGRPQTTKDDIPAVFYKHYPAFASGNMNVSELARICDLSRPTVYKYLKLISPKI